MAVKPQIKANQLAKDLGIKSKEIVDIMAEKGIDLKSQKSLEAREFNILFDALTSAYQIDGIDDYIDGVTVIPSKLEKKAPEAQKVAKETEEKADENQNKIEKTEEKSAKAEKAPAIEKPAEKKPAEKTENKTVKAEKCDVIVIEASDTSENTHKRISDKCIYYKVKHIRIESTCENLGRAVGKSAVAAVAVADESFCRAILGKITES